MEGGVLAALEREEMDNLTLQPITSQEGDTMKKATLAMAAKMYEKFLLAEPSWGLNLLPPSPVPIMIFTIVCMAKYYIAIGLSSLIR